MPRRKKSHRIIYLVFSLIFIFILILVKYNPLAESKFPPSQQNLREKTIIYGEESGLQSTLIAPSKISDTGVPEEQIDRTNTPKKVPIISYHTINDEIKGIKELFVSPSEFEKQMQYLKDNNYTVITFNDLEESYKYKKPIIITFDDGYDDNYTNAYPILKKFNYKATIFIPINVIDKPWFLKTDQIVKMQDLIEFQSHTASHRILTKLTDAEVEKELSESKRILEGLFGKQVYVLAYPEGRANSNILKIASKYYKNAVLSFGGFYEPGVNPYEIKRVYIPRSMDINAFVRKLKEAGNN